MTDCSIVVATHGRNPLLARCLRALARQAYPANAYEVVVADDAASAATRACVERIADASPISIRYVPVLARHGPAAARNVGWRLAHGTVIAFTDDDTVPHEGWVRGFVDAAARGIDAGWGVIIVPTGDPPTDHERDVKGLEHAGFVTANAFCRRDVLDDLGGFDERYPTAWREDSDLFFRLLERGYRVEHVPESVVVHPVRPAPWAASLRKERKHEWDALLYKEHRELYRQYVHPDKPHLYYAIVGALALGAVGAATRRRRLATAGATAWGILTSALAARRLRHTSHAPAHVADVILTSALLPPLSLFWRVRGGIRHRVAFW